MDSGFRFAALPSTLSTAGMENLLVSILSEHRRQATDQRLTLELRRLVGLRVPRLLVLGLQPHALRFGGGRRLGGDAALHVGDDRRKLNVVDLVGLRKRGEER